MAWFMTEDAEEYLENAGAFLTARPAENTQPLTIAETVRLRGRRAFGDAEPLFGWWRGDGGQVEGAFVQTPPYPLVLTPAPEPAIVALADTVHGIGRSLPGVASDPATAGTFAAAWQRRSGASAQVHRRERLYRLGELVPPTPPPPGGARLAGTRDRELLLVWFDGFAEDVGEPGPVSSGQVDARIDRRGLTLWEVDGEPVSMAAVSVAVAGCIRVAPVYTPPEHRGRGYAAAVTAAVSQAALDSGVREVLLFTDLANPTSNQLYQRLGYRPVEDRVVLRFTA